MLNIKEIKEKYTCLDYLGDRVVKKVANGYLARAPWREDAHPSLSITLNGKGWHDLATGEHGNIIDLVMKCRNTTSLADVCAEFSEGWQAKSFSFPLSKNPDGEKEKDGFMSFEVQPLQSRGLYAYLTSRRINTSIARQFLKEAHYSFEQRTDGRYLYALAYGNDLGGYELRSERFKGGTSPKGITTHLGRENAPTVVFEGFFDMLSFATLCGGVKHNYITLNSIVNVDTAIEAIRVNRALFGKIFLCLDNDDAGRSTTKKLLDTFPEAQDISPRFVPHKDVNDFLCHRQLT